MDVLRELARAALRGLLAVALALLIIEGVRP